MLKPGLPRPRTLAAYFAAPFLVGLTTYALHEVQQMVGRTPDVTMTPRPFGIGYMLVIAALTAWGGLGAGLFTLFLSLLSLVFFLVPSSHPFEITRPRDWVEVMLTTVVGATVLLTVHRVRQLREQGRIVSQAAQEGEARLRAIMDAAPVGVVTCDATGILNYANAEAERLWGHSLLKLKQEDWGLYRFFTAEGQPIPPREMGLARVLSGETTLTSREFIMQRPDGSRSWANANTTRMIHPETGEVLGAISAFLDVSAVKEAEARLRRSEENYRFLTESMPQIVWTTQPDGYHDYFNARWFEYTGQTLEETQGWGWSHLLHPDDYERTVNVWKHSLETGEDYNIEYRFLRAQDQSYRWFLGQARAQRDDSGTITRWFGTLTDIHDQWEAQQQRERLLEEDARRARREALLNRIGRVQRGTLNPDAVSTAATRELGQALDADRCYLVVFDWQRGVAAVGADWQQLPFSSMQGQYRLNDAPIDYAALFPRKTSIAVEDCRLHPALQAIGDALTAVGICSLVAVPIYEGDRLFGALTVSTAHPRVWDPDEIELTEAVAAQTRTTMEVATLLQREHNIAERLQEALTPSLPGAVPGLKLAQYYKAALEEASVGGDFFDVFPVEQGCVALVMGDLSGKGLSAASQIATVRNMLRFVLYTTADLGAALTELNRVIAERELLSGFATLWVGIFDSRSLRLRYASAGHEPGLIRRVATGEVEMLGATGPVLGALVGVSFAEQSLSLAPGDTLLLYTDGLSEAGRNRRDFLGIEGMAGLLTNAPDGGVQDEDPRAITAYIVRGVDAHARGAVHDDRCVLTAVVQPRIPMGQPEPRALDSLK